MSKALPESAWWQALLESCVIRRNRAKQLLHSWCVELGRAASDLPQAERGDPVLGEVDDKLWRALRELPKGAERAAAEQASLARTGIRVITRADAAYPEGWLARLDEAHLPYVVYLHGNLELLWQPTVTMASAAEPELLAWAATQDEVVLVSVFEGSWQAADSAQILVLPEGMQAAELPQPLVRACDADHALLLSPVAPGIQTSAVLLNACRALAAALGDVLVSNGEAESAVWLAQLLPPLPPVVRSGSPAELDALLAGDAHHDGGRGSLDLPPAGPVHFRDVESAISELGKTGRVPDALARRLRESHQLREADDADDPA
ncbi:MAG: hypothetical protein GXY52_00610 [Chloroflexi bacterium]|nr:hypothetical protein [Chloroflexota bacterium]